MPYKILAQLSQLTDLFPDQELAVAGGILETTGLVGLDFKLAFPEPLFPDADAVLLKARLTLAELGTIKLVLPALDVELKLLRQAADRYLLQGLDQLDAITAEIELFSGLVIHQGSAILRLGLEPWQLTLERADGTPVASIALPGLNGIGFHVTRLVLDASGVTECEAFLVPGSATIGSLAMHVTQGTLVLRGSQVEARLQARFELAYFRNASVDLELTVSANLATSDWAVTGLTRLANNVPWRDPSGMLSFDQMSVAVGFARAGAGATATVTIGGRLTFLPQQLAADADAWFGGLFSGLAVSFAHVPLDLADVGPAAFAFTPPEGLHLRAFEVFDMRVPALAFDKTGVTLRDAVLRFEAGGAVLSGRVASIRISLIGGPKLAIDAGPSIAIELAAPGGFKGQASLTQVDEPNVLAVRGSGRISSPALAPVEAIFQIGRFRPKGSAKWEPTLSVMVAQEDVNVALFPGVVATRVELGAGINRRVAGVTGLSLADGRRKLQEGLPDVFRHDSWEDHPCGLCVVVRLFAESSQTHGDQALSLYVADVTLLMTLELQFAAFGKLWFYTRRADARTPDFQKQPSAVGLAMFDGQQPSLRVVAMTHPDGRSSMTDSIPAGRLLGMQIPRAQLAFEATPSGMALALGPVEVGTMLGPLRVAGSTQLVLRSAGGRVYALSRSSLSAGFAVSTGSVSIGPATLSGSVSAGFSATLALLGNFESGVLTVYGLAHASCTVELALHVRIGFRIRISVGFGSITISWHEDWDFSMRLHVDLDLEAALTSDGAIGIDGRAGLSVQVLGISASLSLHVDWNGDVVTRGRAVYNAVTTNIAELLGDTA